MKNIYCKTKAEYENLPKSFDEYTIIHIQFLENSHVVARENSHVVAWENSRVVARENSYVEAWENSRVIARENSRVVAWENSRVVARDDSHVVARDESRVVARENSYVVAWANSNVEAWANSYVEAWENSRVVARENSRVVAWGNNTVYNYSTNTDISIMFYAVCFMIKASKSLKQSKTATIIYTKCKNNLETFIDLHGMNLINGKHTLYKKVSEELKTQENTKNETLWQIGSTLIHSNWNPVNECGEGKYHACPKTFFCDEFRSNQGDRYVEISVYPKDLYTHEHPNFPHKIAFRECVVESEVDRYGNRI
jgi:alpha-tubulin suppressor-like RCC1 family protein